MSVDPKETIRNLYNKVFYEQPKYSTNASFKDVLLMVSTKPFTDTTSLENVLNFLIYKTNLSLRVLPTIYKSTETGANKLVRTVSDSKINLDSESDEEEDIDLSKPETLFMKSFKILSCLESINKDYLDNEDFVKIFTAYTWNNIKWFALHTQNVYNFLDVIVPYLNKLTRPNYVTKLCSEKYTCGRAELDVGVGCKIYDDKKTRVIIFDSTSTDDMSMNPETVKKACEATEVPVLTGGAKKSVKKASKKASKKTSKKTSKKSVKKASKKASKKLQKGGKKTSKKTNNKTSKKTSKKSSKKTSKK
jgi:hypothetical protein